ncbi:MAG: phospho-N-acetylmuramoyl-pentapeptide-transferase [Clostridia bacterium]|nr:phospho-N-acetylmuramoyl-pentapeptide-transferase [Clostridia bacterium]
MNGLILAVAGVVSFVVAAVLGRWVIPWLARLKFGQTIREEGPSWHEKKQGTPTMGGILFMAGFLVAALLCAWLIYFLKPAHMFMSAYEKVRYWGGIGLAFGCGVIGFADDFIKVVKKRNLGLTAIQKLIAQLVVATGYAVLMYCYRGGVFSIPFIGLVDWGFWYIPFTVFVIVAMTNATNLTDGVDGLCGLTGFVASLALMLLGGLTGQLTQSVLAAALAGALSGFLLWNFHPAQVFMGDTGSLFIGGALTALAFGIEQPFLLVPIGILYIAENLSVILQVTYFKLTHGKRLFKMSPLHHHFEMCGWSENKIVLVFSAVTLVGGIGAILLQYFG